MAHDIGAWLEGLGLGKYAEAFVKNGVDLRALPHLSEDDLKQLGGQCQSKFVYFAKTSEPDFAVIDFLAFSESI